MGSRSHELSKGSYSMKRKFQKTIAVGMSLAFLCASIPATNEAQAASKPKLSTSSLSLTVGQSKKISVKGASGTVKWTSSNKKIVTVAKTGKAAAKGIDEYLSK